MQGVIFAKRFNYSTRYSLIISFCVVMAFCSFSSLVGEMCGPSPENPNVVRLLDLKNYARDVKAHLKLLLLSIVPLGCFYCLQIELQFKCVTLFTIWVISVPISYTVDRARESGGNQACISRE